MDWIIEMLLNLFCMSFRESPPTVVGESRLDREAKQFWQKIVLGALALAVAITIYVRW